ncbi:HD family phosphohydrolase [Clostridia bacterium]|nr:HD family phosphohydrolase [Clostridia bacterium]
MDRVIDTMDVDDILDGMIVDDDIYNDHWILLAPKGGILTVDKIALLKKSHIKTVNIRIPVSSVTERADFKEFTENYDKQLDQAQEAIKSISDGALVDMDDLYSMTSGIMDTLKCKSDVFTYLGFLHEYDDYTFSHSSNVALLANVFSQWMKFEEEDVRDLTIAGMLHDIGKTKVPIEILNKPAKLTEDEFKVIQLHTINGYTILKDRPIPNRIKLAALNHHERINGMGYPRKIGSDKIDQFSKIISICDVYDAMTANRCYRGKLCPFDVIGKLETQSYGEMDTNYLIAFLKHIAYNYLNSWVRLSNDDEAEIIFINPTELTRPIVKIRGHAFNLAENREVKIVSIL